MTFLNGAAALGAAASLQTQDTTTLRLPGGIHAADSTVDMLLFGDKVTPIVQWIFQKPPWVMWTGAIVAGSAFACVGAGTTSRVAMGLCSPPTCPTSRAPLRMRSAR